MKKIIPLLLLIATTFLCNYGCKKNERFMKKGGVSSSSFADYGGNDYHVSDTSHSDSAITYTVLGDGYTNPFRSDIIMQAWNSLSENDLATPPVTHHYVKFTPQSVEQLAELIETRLPLFDFPLDYEIETLGHVWTNSATIPEMYTYIPITSTMPGIPYQILYDVCFIQIESIIAEEAFDIAGLSSNYPYKRTDEPNSVYDNCPADINTVIDGNLGWRELTWEELHPYGGGVGGYNNGGLDFNTPTPNDVSNHCNCGNNDDDREPSGCVLVEETQFVPHWSGVRDVKIDLLGPFSQYMRGATSQTGCFRFSRKMRYKVGNNRLPVHMRVSFKSHEVTIRSALPGGLSTTIMPAVHNVGNVAQFTGLNWIRVFYHRSRTQFGLSTAYYSAASLNNAHYEHKDMSWQDGIPAIPSGMRYLVHPYSDAGSAPMLQKLIASGNPASIIQIGTALWVFGGLPVIGGQSAQQYLALCPPDIAFGTNQGTTFDDFASDRIKEVMYHEMGHTMHFMRAGNQFWLDNIAYVAGQSVASVGANPYGNGTAAGWDKCALVEMWGFHIGFTYTHRRYGVNHSAGVDPITNSWFARLESQLMWWAFIPVGLPHDLMDNNIQNLNVNAGLTDHAAMGPTPGTLDDVAGFSNLILYNELGSNSQNIFQWRDNIRNNQLPSTWNSVNSYNALLGTYGL